MKSNNGVLIDETAYTAKGIAIVLLVLGHYHLAGSFSAFEPGYWIKTGWIIFSFLMPFFVLMSGYLFLLKDKDNSSLSGLPEFAYKKFKRLMVPYFSVSFLLAGIKYLAGYFTQIQIPVSKDLLGYIIWNPLSREYSSILWFLYALFLITIIYFFMNCFVKSVFVIFAFSLPLSFFPWPEYFCLNKVFLLMPFFCIGIILRNSKAVETDRPLTCFLMSSFVFFILTVLNEYVKIPGSLAYINFILNISGSAVCFYMAVLAEKIKIKGLLYLRAAGYYSMAIYLFHTIFMGPVKILFFQIMKYDRNVFEVSIFFACGIGLLMPIFFDRYLIRPYRITAFLFSGQKRSKPVPFSSI